MIYSVVKRNLIMPPVMTAYFADVGITNSHDGVHICTCWHTTGGHTEMGVSSAYNRSSHLKPACTWMNVFLWSNLFGLLTCGSNIACKTLPYRSMSTSTSSTLLIIHFGINNSLSWQKIIISGLYTCTRLINYHTGRGGPAQSSPDFTLWMKVLLVALASH